MEIKIADSSFNQASSLLVSAQKIATFTFGAGFEAASPLININTNGNVASKPVEIKVPATVANNKIPVAYYLNSVSGELEPVPVKSFSSDSISFTAQTFSSAVNLSGKIRGSFVMPSDGFIMNLVPDSILSESVSSDFSLEDACAVAAWPTTVATEPADAISALTMFYYNLKARYGAAKFSTLYPGTLANQWQDNVETLRYYSMIQHFEMDAWNKHKMGLTGRIPEDGKITLVQVKDCFKRTKRPVFIAMFDSGLSKVQLVVAYKAVGSKIYFVDPVRPTEERYIELSGSSFGTYQTAPSKSEFDSNNLVSYSKFVIVPTDDFFNWKNFSKHEIYCSPNWHIKAKDSTTQELFTRCRLFALAKESSSSENYIEMNIASGLETYDSSVELLNKVEVYSGHPQATYANARITVFCNGNTYDQIVDSTKGQAVQKCVNLPLNFGENKVIVWYSFDQKNWIDTKEVTITRKAALASIAASQTAEIGNSPIDLKQVTKISAKMNDNSESVVTDNIQFELLYGPGTISGTTYTPVDGKGFVDIRAIAILNGKTASATLRLFITPETKFTETFNRSSISFEKVSNGSFIMGDSSNSSTSPEHRVNLTKRYAVGVAEITQANYQAIMNDNPSYWNSAKKGISTDNHPVDSANFFDVIEFCNKLSDLKGLTKVYTVTGEGSAKTVTFNQSANGYRLPTESEWEYFAKAGATTDYHWGLNFSDRNTNLSVFNNAAGEYAWSDEKNSNGTQDIMQLKPNRFGLFDTAGNLREMVWDDSADYPSTEVTDPYGPSLSGTIGDRRVRGGCYQDVLAKCSTVYRTNRPNSAQYEMGFRVIRNLE